MAVLHKVLLYNILSLFEIILLRLMSSEIDPASLTHYSQVEPSRCNLGISGSLSRAIFGIILLHGSTVISESFLV